MKHPKPRKLALTKFWRDYFQKYPFHGSNDRLNDLREEWLEQMAKLNDAALQRSIP